MSKDLKLEQQQELSFAQLKNMVGPHFSKAVKWVTYEQIQGSKTIAQVFGGKKLVVILIFIKPDRTHFYETTHAGHFILLINHEHSIEHFDSYGLGIDEELAITHENPFLKQLLNASKKEIINNTTKLQRFKENINTCGRWVVARILLHHLSLEKFIEEVTNLGYPNDESVTLLTMLLPYKK